MTILRSAGQFATTPGRVPRISAVTYKTVMAGSGLVFALFVVVHMVGNLKVYEGRHAFDGYAAWLRTVLQPLLPREGLLWIVRGVLSISLIAHVWCSVALRSRARRARGAFPRKGLGTRLLGARTMLLTGAVLLCFIAFHLLDLTTGTRPLATTGYQTASTSTSHAYDNLVNSFKRPAAAAFYVIAMGLLGLHLTHGLRTVVNDLGVTGQRLRQATTSIAGTIGLAIFVGNASIPIAVQVGLVR